MSKLVGLYASPQQMNEDPRYFDTLKSELGLTHVIMGGQFILSEKTMASNPMPAGSEDQAPGYGGAEDSELRSAIDAAHEKDLTVWFCTGGWHGGGGKFPEMCMQDMHRRPLTEAPELRFAREQHALSFCPSNAALNTWLRSVIHDVMSGYPYDGVDLTHFRYTAPILTK